MKTALAIVVIIIVLAGSYFLFVHKAQAPATSAPTTTAAADLTNTAQPAVSTPTATAQTVTVTYTDKGFSPNTVNIKKGDTVTFVNNSSGQMWVASNPHPIHNGYSGTTVSQHCPDTAGVAFDECSTVGAGGRYTFTFQRIGSWGYHNHAQHSDTGTVNVAN